MDKEAGGPNIQDHYLARARKDRSWLTVILNSGKKIGGRVVSFDRYTVLLEDHGQEQMVFKHAIATINASRSFSNTMRLDRDKTGKGQPRRGAEAPSEAKAEGGELAEKDVHSKERPEAG